MHASFGQVPGVHLGGMPLGVHLGMPPQLTGRPPFFERPFPVVRLRGLPFNAGELDVMEFFQGLDPVDVLLTRRDGRSTGEAYVLFGTPMQMDFALQKNRHSMGRRYIEVFRAKKAEYYAAVASHVADPGLTPAPAAAPGVMGQTVPLHAQAAAFNANHVAAAPPQPVAGADTAASDAQQQPGESLPASSGDAVSAAGGGVAGIAAPVPLPGGVDLSVSLGGVPPLGATGLRDVRAVRPEAGVATAHTGVLKLRGLPFSASKDDIIAFFDDPMLGVTPLVHDSIHIVTSLDGRPSGVAFAEFSCAEDARSAMRKDRGSMGARYVELFASSREEATRAATAAR